MTTRTISAIAVHAGRLGAHEYALAAAITSNWAAFRAMLARAASRRRLARSIAHLDDRLLADVGLAPEHRGLGDRLIRSAWATRRSVSKPARPPGGTLAFR